MSTQLAVAPQKASALAIMAGRYNVEPAKLLSTLKNTAFKGATDDQMLALVVVANEHELNPFTREIYAFPDKSGGIVPVVGIDGWIRRMNNHEQFDGIEFEMEEAEDGTPISCKAMIYRKDRTRPTSLTEYYAECKRNTDPWRTSPRRMLRHRALIQCARVAFGFSGADPDEVENMREASGRVVVGVDAPTKGGFVKKETPVVEAVVEEAPKKRGRPKKADPEPEAPVDAKILLGERLEAEEITPDQAAAVFVDQGLLSEGQKFSDLDSETAEMVLENWETFISTVK